MKRDNSRLKITMVLLAVFTGKLSGMPIDTSLIDILRSFTVGREWTYSYSWSEYQKEFPLSWIGWDVFSANFTGTLTVTILNAEKDTQSNLTCFQLNLRTRGIERRMDRNGEVIAVLSIDSSNAAAILEDSTEISVQGVHAIRGWLFPDTVANRISCGPERKFYPLPRLYRYYRLPVQDIFEVRGDTLYATVNMGDCWDSPAEKTYAIVPDSGVVLYTTMAAAWVPFGGFVYGFSLELKCLGSEIVDNIVKEDPVPRFNLSPNYPNPFNPATTIQYSVPGTQHVSLKIYDVLGREVATLVNEVKQPGYYAVTWDASGCSSGVYFYRLEAGKYVDTNKMILLH
jgi:hypothetical protein